ncbi:MAG: ring-cleaving dioxygenase [Chloroflexi bacterium HGW-Chloroflexi-10]|nr:MAG: ring-cleaving dioxygenase [Chloroflexi bacterium HGW-Chloroflexi-10]
MSTTGLHHITAVAKDPQTNIDFYQQVLGQRLVKTTINFDDPGTYHLYYGDNLGSPGTALTFFPWMHMQRGQRGAGETTSIEYAVLQGSLSYWAARLKQFGFAPGRVESNFGQEVLPFTDPDGMRIRLVAVSNPPQYPLWPGSPIPAEHQLDGFLGVTLELNEVEPTAVVLTEALGYRFVGQEGPRYRYVASEASAANGGSLGSHVDILNSPLASENRFGAGSIHHIAFRAADDAHQAELRRKVIEIGEHPTQVIDRQYFRSVYFRTPGGVLFEIATDDPGFTFDESVDQLGGSLRLPRWMETRRTEIEAALPSIRRTMPQVTEVSGDG